MDADAIIKLNRAEVLAHVVRAHDCVVTDMVYEEVVIVGRARGYTDADPIERILADAERIPFEGEAGGTGLGRGESSILAILGSQPDSTVVTDDQQFRATLSRLGVSALASTTVVVLLVREGWLNAADGIQVLASMKPCVDDESYSEARSRLLNTGGGRG